MTKEFDARNENKSRSVCAAMAEAADTGKRVLTERERAILDMWPRFEDTGDPVMVGDAYIDGSGDCNIIVAVRICDACVDLVGEDAFLTGFKPGERVKRPVQSVLDADGVEIKVGDTVWHEDGTMLMADGFGGVEDGETIVNVHIIRGATPWREVRSLSLTHTRPDSWERLEDDAREFARDNQLPHDVDQMERDAVDLIRRAKKLAGVE